MNLVKEDIVQVSLMLIGFTVDMANVKNVTERENLYGDHYIQTI
jgi:hypothetical protein